MAWGYMGSLERVCKWVLVREAVGIDLGWVQWGGNGLGRYVGSWEWVSKWVLVWKLAGLFQVGSMGFIWLNVPILLIWVRKDSTYENLFKNLHIWRKTFCGKSLLSIS